MIQISCCIKESIKMHKKGGCKNYLVLGGTFFSYNRMQGMKKKKKIKLHDDDDKIKAIPKCRSKPGAKKKLQDMEEKLSAILPIWASNAKKVDLYHQNLSV